MREKKRERERERECVSTHHHHSTGEESLHQLNEGLNGMEQSCRSTRLQDEAVCRHIHAALTTEREERGGGQGVTSHRAGEGWTMGVLVKGLT